MRNNRNNGRFNNNFRRHNNYNNNSSSPQFNRNSMFDSNGPSGKIRGTAFQLYEKYDKTAKDLVSQGDDIAGEICSQYADHFFRIHQSTMPAEREPVERADFEQPGEESDNGGEAARPSRSQRAAIHQQTKEAAPDDEPPASQITTEFTVPNVEQMDLSIPIAVMASDNHNAEDFKQRGRGRPRKNQLETGE